MNMSGLLETKTAQIFTKLASKDVFLPGLSAPSRDIDHEESKFKSKKKRDTQNYTVPEKCKSRRKRSKSCHAGSHSITLLKDKGYFTQIREECTDVASNARLPQVTEVAPARYSLKYSRASSSNSEIDRLFREKLDLGTGDGPVKCPGGYDRAKRDGALSEKQLQPLKTEEKQKKPKKVALLVSIKPENQDSEMDKFMKTNFTYNPVFEYKYLLSTGALDKYKNPSDALITVGYAGLLVTQLRRSQQRCAPPFIASLLTSTYVTIFLRGSMHLHANLEHKARKFGTYENFEDRSGGRRLTEDEIAEAARVYLQEEGLENDVRVNLSKDLVSRGCMSKIKGHPTLQVRVDNIRENWMEGLLRHEIGTHYLRSYNNSRQPWARNKKRKKYDLHPQNPTEEGLASLHSVLFRASPCMYRSALLYYVAYQASQMSFVELFRDIGRFVRDKETRWNYCLRAKRGQVDTSKPGGFCKDQVYLKGAMQILKHRHEINFHHLVQCGKVDYRDVDRLTNLADLEQTRIPAFMEDMAVYKAALDDIVTKNGLTNNDFIGVD